MRNIEINAETTKSQYIEKGSDKEYHSQRDSNAEYTGATRSREGFSNTTSWVRHIHCNQDLTVSVDDAMVYAQE